MTRDDVAGILAENPRLGLFGFYPETSKKANFAPVSAAQLADCRSKLLDKFEVCGKVCNWFHSRGIFKDADYCNYISTRSLAFKISKDLGETVPHGAVIVAALHLGLKARAMPGISFLNLAWPN